LAQKCNAISGCIGTRVYSRNRGWFAPENKDLETLARQEAEAQILRTACEDGVLSKATEHAEATLRQFLGLIEGVTTIVRTAPPAACPGPGPRQGSRFYPLADAGRRPAHPDPGL